MKFNKVFEPKNELLEGFFSDSGRVRNPTEKFFFFFNKLVT